MLVSEFFSGSYGRNWTSASLKLRMRGSDAGGSGPERMLLANAGNKGWSYAFEAMYTYGRELLSGHQINNLKWDCGGREISN